MDKTIKLKTAITVSGAQVSTLNMREPDVNDSLAAQEAHTSAAMQEVTLIANLCGLAPEDIRRLKLSDYHQCQKALKDFFG